MLFKNAIDLVIKNSGKKLIEVAAAVGKKQTTFSDFKNRASDSKSLKTVLDVCKVCGASVYIDLNNGVKIDITDCLEQQGKAADKTAGKTADK